MIVLPLDSWYIPVDMPWRNGAQAYSADQRKIAELANRGRACDRTIFNYTWRSGYGPTIATKAISYPTDVTKDCITRVRCDLPQDLTTQQVQIRGVIYVPSGNKGSLTNFKFANMQSAGATKPWEIGDVTLSWSDAGEAQYIPFVLQGNVPPNYRFDSAISATEEITLNAYGTWAADSGSTGSATILHLTVVAQGFLTLDPDLTEPENLAVAYPLPGSDIEWSDWYREMRQSQDLLYAYDTARLITGQTHEGDYNGYQVTLTNTTYGINMLGDDAEWWIPVQGRKYNGDSINILAIFYTDLAVSAVLKWTDHDTPAGYAAAGATFTTQAGGWNRIERSINVGSSEIGILLKLCGKGTTSPRTSGFGVRFHNKSIMDSIT